MKRQLVLCLKQLCPFLVLILLWRLNISFWNPAGILALIPIFYCTFIYPVKFFAPVSLIFCFLIDYQLNTLCFWTAGYCFLYAINGFQNFIDLEQTEKNGLYVFSLLFTIGVAILSLINITWSGLIKGIWLILWASVLYFPITELIKRVRND